ncbi:MAG: hypothetical protein QGG54_11590 [Gammaproteobacteria bacterium]|nr:hypothetical protein [Gammaproteobacteria bacterium]
MGKVQDQAPDRSKAEQQWMDENLAEQSLRHEDIVAAMEALAAEREGWVSAFLERIQTRGFNYNCDALRKIEADELPKKPDKPFKVVF